MAPKTVMTKLQIMTTNSPVLMLPFENNQIKFFVMIAVLRRSVTSLLGPFQRLCAGGQHRFFKRNAAAMGGR